MPASGIYLVQVFDAQHNSTVMSGITVAAGPREAAQLACAARFGKWTGASLVRVESICGRFRGEFPFDSVAPDD